MTKAAEALDIPQREDTALQGLLAAHGAAFAVWPDRNGPDGAGTLLIKSLQGILDLCESRAASA